MAHSHSHNEVSGEKNLRTAFFLNLFFTFIELFGGLYVNSVAILSDAIHDLGDSLSLGTAWFLERKSQKPPNENYNFGYRRFSVLGALLNSVILIFGSFFIIKEAVARLQHPEISDAKGMIALAVLGIIVNGWAVMKLQKGNSLNEKVVSLHLMEDVLGWVAVLIVAIILLFVEVPVLDPLLSLGITAYILWGTFKRLWESIYILMQGKPKYIDIENLKSALQGVDGSISEVEIKIWSLDGEKNIINIKVYLTLESFENVEVLKSKMHSILKPYSFHYQTIEFILNQHI